MVLRRNADMGLQVDDAFMRQLLTNGQFKQLPFNSALPVGNPVKLVVYAKLPGGWGEISPDRLQDAIRTRGPNSTTTMFRTIFHNLLDPKDYELLKTQLMTEEDKQERFNDMFAGALEDIDGSFDSLFRDRGVTGLFKKANQPSYAIVVKLPRGMEARDIFRPVTVPPDEPPSAYTLPREAVIEAMSRALPEEDENDDGTFAFDREDPERPSLRQELSAIHLSPKQYEGSSRTNKNPESIQLITELGEPNIGNQDFPLIGEDLVVPNMANETFDMVRPESSSRSAQLSERSPPRNSLFEAIQAESSSRSAQLSERSPPRNSLLDAIQAESSSRSAQRSDQSQRNSLFDAIQAESSSRSAQRSDQSSQRNSLLDMIQPERSSQRSQRSDQSQRNSLFDAIQAERSSQGSQRSDRSSQRNSLFEAIQPESSSRSAQRSDQSSQRNSLLDMIQPEQPTQFPPILTGDLDLVNGLETDLIRALEGVQGETTDWSTKE